METIKTKARDSNIMNRDDTEMEDEAGKGQEGEEKGLEGKEAECLKGNGQQDGNEDIGFDTHADDDGYGNPSIALAGRARTERARATEARRRLRPLLRLICLGR